MRRMTLTIKTVIALGVLVLSCSMAQAGPDRTWVSGVNGDDVNSCSRTAPCKTFASAYTKTAIGGIINVVDAGGYGGVTIDHAITIDASESMASVIAANDTNGFTINAGPSDVIVLRGLNLQGGGKKGIRFLAGGKLYVEDCRIFGFQQEGISFEPTGKSELFVKDSTIRENGLTGILVQPAAGGTARATIDHCKLDGNASGLAVWNDSKVVMRDSSASSNTVSGVVLVAGAAASPEANIASCLINYNAANGISSAGNKTKVRLSGSTVTGNDNGLLSAFGGTIDSFGDNKVDGNFSMNGVPDNPILQQ
jgi:hypothetical protein